AALAQRLGFFHRGRRVFSCFFLTRDLLRLAVALGLQRLRLGDELAAALVDGTESAQRLRGVHAAAAQHGFYLPKIVTNEREIEHESKYSTTQSGQSPRRRGR